MANGQLRRRGHLQDRRRHGVFPVRLSFALTITRMSKIIMQCSSLATILFPFITLSRHFYISMPPFDYTIGPPTDVAFVGVALTPRLCAEIPSTAAAQACGVPRAGSLSFIRHALLPCVFLRPVLRVCLRVLMQVSDCLFVFRHNAGRVLLEARFNLIFFALWGLSDAALSMCTVHALTYTHTRTRTRPGQPQELDGRVEAAGRRSLVRRRSE